MGDEDEREEERREEGADVVDGKDFRNEIAERVFLPENPHEERNFKADERAGDHDERVEKDSERGDVLESREKDRRRTSADQADEDLDPDEDAREIPDEELREVGTDPHREE